MSSLIDTDTTATPTPTEPETRVMEWGGTVPSAAPVAWGARAIYKIGSVEVRFTKAGKRLKRPREVTEATIDILWDRQSWHGEPAACKALSAWLNKKALPALRRECVARYITGDSDERVEIDGDGYKLVASPRESYGYLYITAWKVRVRALGDVSVLSRDDLDAEHAAKFDKQWLMLHEDGSVEQFDTEDAACAAQREWRTNHNLNPLTGEKTGSCACGKCKPERLANRGAVSGRCTCCGVLVCEAK